MFFPLAAVYAAQAIADGLAHRMPTRHLAWPAQSADTMTRPAPTAPSRAIDTPDCVASQMAAHVNQQLLQQGD